MAGIPARSVGPESDAAVAPERERGSLLALAANPLWFLSDARRLLRAGASQAPVHYDVRVGLEKHRNLASTTASASQAPGVAAASAATHTSAGMAIVGAGAAGLAAVAAIAAALSLHSAPPPSEDERIAEHRSVAATASAVALSTHSNPSSLAAASPLPPADPSARADEESARAAHGPAIAKQDVTRDAQPARASTETVRAAPPAASEMDKPSRSKAVESTASPTSSAMGEQAAPKGFRDTSVASTDTQVEAREIARAERLLSSNPAGALAIVREARARLAPSFLGEERDYIEVMALHALGRSDEAESAAARFLKTYPGGAFGRRVRKVMGQ